MPTNPCLFRAGAPRRMGRMGKMGKMGRMGKMGIMGIMGNRLLCL